MVQSLAVNTRNANHIISRRLLEARLSAGISRAELAKEIGVSYQQLEKYEKGVNRISAGTLSILAKTLGQSLDWFAEHSQEKAFVSADDHKIRFMTRANTELLKVNSVERQDRLLKLLRFFVKEEV